MIDQETPTEDQNEAPAAEAAEVAPPSESDNFVKYLTEEQQKKVSGDVIRRFEADISGREPRMKRLRDIQNMYAMVAKKKNFPWHNCANVKTPTLTGPALQIQARLFDMIWPATGKIFYVVAGAQQNLDDARKAEEFANSYVRYRMPYLSQGLDDTLHQMCLYGSAFRRTYWDHHTRKVRSDWVPIEDFVVNHKFRSQDPSMSDVPHYTYVDHLTIHEVMARGETGTFENTALVKGRVKSIDGSDSAFRQATEKIDGTSQTDEESDDEPRQILEQHFVWETPSMPTAHPVFDGKARPVIATVDGGTGQLLALRLREEDDPDDIRRFERETARYEQYSMDLQAHAAALQAYQMAQTTTVAGPMGIMDGAQMGPPPAPPEEVPAPQPVRRRQVCLFTHYRCFPSEGFYGLGYGDLLYGIAEANNTTINQHLDGMSLKNAKPGFINRNVRMQRGSINVAPGQFNEVDMPVGSSLKDVLQFVDVPQSDPTTVRIIDIFDGMADKITGNSDIMSGQAPGSNQTKAGMQILAEQAMAPISVLGRRVKECLKHELDKIWRCWGVFLSDEEIQEIVGDGATQQSEVKISRVMFTPNAHLVPAADPRMKSQRIEDHQALFGYVINNPWVMNTPPVRDALLPALTEAGLHIYPDGERLIPLLKQAQQQAMQPPAPPPAAPPFEENANFMNDQDHPVHPDDDDEAHIGEHMTFEQSPEAQRLNKPGREMLERHIRSHIAQRIQKQGAAREQMAGPIPQGHGGMADVPPDQAASGLPPGMPGQLA